MKKKKRPAAKKKSSAKRKIGKNISSGRKTSEPDSQEPLLLHDDKTRMEFKNRPERENDRNRKKESDHEHEQTSDSDRTTNKNSGKRYGETPNEGLNQGEKEGNVNVTNKGVDQDTEFINK